jgi:hypothetical protein
MSAMTPRFVVPDSKLANRAVAVAEGLEPQFLVHHSHRTFQFGSELLSLSGRSFDEEMLFVACMLHDMALGTEVDDGTTPFQVRGAGLAAKEVLAAGRSEAESKLVYDGIALHMELSTADDARAEVAGVHLGAAADVIGMRIDQIAPDQIEALIDAYPRDAMKTQFAEVIGAEAQGKPYSQAATLVHEFGFLALIDAAPFKS